MLPKPPELNVNEYLWTNLERAETTQEPDRTGEFSEEKLAREKRLLTALKKPLYTLILASFLLLLFKKSIHPSTFHRLFWVESRRQ